MHPGELEELRGLVDADAREALARASVLLPDAASAAEAAELMWITGLAHRAGGDAVAARSTQERAWELAVSTDDRALAARIAITLAFDVAHAGDIIGASNVLDLAEPDVHREDAADMANQRGALAYRLGRFDEAAQAFRRARQLARSRNQVATELRVLGNLGATLAQIGDHTGAVAVLNAAIDLAAASSGPTGLGLARHNLAFVEARFGNLPTALEQFALATEEYVRAHDLELVPRILANHALTLAEANLLADAEELIERAVAMARRQGNEIELAEIELIAAEIDLARGATAEARDGAATAEQRFNAQSRERWAPAARLVRLRAEARLTPTEPAVATELVETAGALSDVGWRAAALSASSLAAVLHAEAGREPEATALLARLGREVSRVRTIDRLVLARAVAVLADRRGDRPTGRRAVSQGLRLAAASQATLGALEVRAHAAEHGAALIEIGARWAVADRRPRELLERIESMRTMMWQAPLVRPPDEEGMAAALAELRRTQAIINDPDAETNERIEAGRDQLRLERTVRDISRRARSDRPSVATGVRFAVRRAIEDVGEIGDHQLLAYGNLDGQLLAVSVDRGRCRLHHLGSAADVSPILETSSFALHRLNRHGVSPASRASAASTLEAASDQLAAALLPDRVRRSRRPLVIVPTDVLNGVPWRAIRVLDERSVSVSPSLTGWSNAARAAAEHAARRRRSGRAGREAESVALLAGPGLAHADEEVAEIATLYDDPFVLTGIEASATGALAAIDRADLVHLACHGRFRSDNPLFSTLLMADGPLTVYDLERVAMPEIAVLSACSVGNSTALNGGTLLGLASALGTFGASSVIAPLVPVNDHELIALMRSLHEGLAAGRSAAESLAHAAATSPAATGVGEAFVAIGA